MARWFWGAVCAISLVPGVARAEESLSIASAREEPVRLSVTSDEPGVVLYGKLPSQKGYSLSCKAPCSLELMPGAYELAAGRPERSFVASQELFYVGQPSNLEVKLSEGASLRTWGIATMLTGLLVGGVLLQVSLNTRTRDHGDYTENEVNFAGPTAMLGAATACAGIGVGITLMLKKDKASFDLTPQAPGR